MSMKTHMAHTMQRVLERIGNEMVREAMVSAINRGPIRFPNMKKKPKKKTKGY